MRASSQTVRVSVGLVVAVLVWSAPSACLGHGTVIYPASRVYRVYQSNPANPNFPLAVNAVQIDGQLSYYTWNEVSRNIAQAVVAGLPPGFDYSPWMPDGQLASAGRIDPQSLLYPRTYAGLDQVSTAWPKTALTQGETIAVRFRATAPHNPSVWDVWMTRPTWDAATPLRWSEMEFLGRPTVAFSNGEYRFDLTVPMDRSGHHVLWVAWQRDDPVGEVFISASDIDIQPRTTPLFPGSGDDLLLASGVPGMLTSLPPGDVAQASIGTLWSLAMRTPGGVFAAQPYWLLGMPLPAGPPTGPLFGFPDVWVDPARSWMLDQGAMMPPAGISVTVNVPVWTLGQQFLFQGLATATQAQNGTYATTDAHLVSVVP